MPILRQNPSSFNNWPQFPSILRVNEATVYVSESYEPGATVWRDRGGGQLQVQEAQLEADLQRRPGKGEMDPDPKKGTKERDRESEEEEEEEEKDLL